MKLIDILKGKGYNPNRVPSGPGGGRFASGSGGAAPAASSKNAKKPGEKKSPSRITSRKDIARILQAVRKRTNMTALKEDFPDLTAGQIRSAIRHGRKTGKVEADRVSTGGDSVTQYGGKRSNEEQYNENAYRAYMARQKRND